MKSVLHIKLEAPGFSSSGIEKGLKVNFEEYYSQDWQKIKFNEGILGFQERLLNKAYMERAEVIFLHVQNAGILDAQVMQELSSISFTVLYTMDIREDLNWMKDLAPYTGLILLPDMESVDEMRASGFMNTEFSHSACDMDIYKPLKLKEKVAPEIVFIGNNYQNTSLNFPLIQQRADMVKCMQDNFGDQFAVYGNGWPGSKLVNMQEEINILNSCKIAVTHSHFNRRFYASDRLWRSLACGPLVMSQYYYGINQDFRPGILKPWLNFEMLKTECEKYLKLENEFERKTIGKAGAAWVRQNHSWSNRIQTMIGYIEKHKAQISN